MNDRDIMENLLLTTKGVCDLFMHGSIESSTADVHQAFTSALGSSLAVSDAGTGAVFAWAAMYGAALNVLANTRLMADRERAADMNRSVNKLMQEYRVRADRVYGDIFAKLSDK